MRAAHPELSERRACSLAGLGRFQLTVIGDKVRGFRVMRAFEEVGRRAPAFSWRFRPTRISVGRWTLFRTVWTTNESSGP